MSFVVADLGASGNRYSSASGKICMLPNNMVFLKEDEDSMITPDSNEIEASLEIMIKKENAEDKNFPAHILMGIMADKHPGIADRPSVSQHKHKQRINYVSSIVMAAMSRIKLGNDENITLYIAVPPIEIHQAREHFAKGLIGKYQVFFPKYQDGKVVKLNIVDVKCHEESFMSSTSFFFNMNGTPKEENKKYLSGTVLSLDIGASTTDLAIIKAGRYLDKSGQTYKTGGNEVRDYVSNEVCARYAMDMSIEDADKTLCEGRLQLGNTYEDITDIIDTAKKSLAKKLANHMQTYFKRIDIDIRTINAIIVSGGGSLQSQYVNEDGEVVKTSEPMSHYVTEELMQWSPGTDVVPYGEDARLANIMGLFIKANIDLIRSKAQQNQA